MSTNISRKINFVGGFALAAGILTGLWFFTVGLIITLWSYDTNKDIMVFLFLIGGIIFSAMLIKGGIGVLRRRSSSRVLLIISFYLAATGIILYLLSNIIGGLKEVGNEYFVFSSWIGGILFCLFLGTLCILQAAFLNRPDVKELF